MGGWRAWQCSAVNWSAALNTQRWCMVAWPRNEPMPHQIAGADARSAVHISVILRYLYEKPPHDNRTCGCTVLAGLVKPDIVFFGESLPERFHSLLEEDFPKCDLLIVMGTSLLVQPFASLVDMVDDTAPRPA